MDDRSVLLTPNPTRGLDAALGVTYERMEADEVVAVLTVGEQHRQPLGYLHGGVNVALAESVASIGATLAAPDGHAAFGMEINANHLRPVRDGLLRAAGRPIHRGKSTQVWEVRVTDGTDRLVCVSRCTLAIVPVGGEKKDERRDDGGA